MVEFARRQLAAFQTANKDENFENRSFLLQKENARWAEAQQA